MKPRRVPAFLLACALVFLLLGSPAAPVAARPGRPSFTPVAAATRFTGPGLGPIYRISVGAAVKKNVEFAYNWQHNEYMVVWENVFLGTNPPPSDIRGRRLSSSGLPLSPEFVVYQDASRNCSAPSIAYDQIHDKYLVVFSFEAFPGLRSIMGRLVPWDGPSGPLTDFAISDSPADETTPRVAYDLLANGGAGVYLVVWASSTGVQSAITDRQVSAAGAALGSPETLIGTAGEMRANPDIVFNPNLAYNEFLIAYEYVLFGQTNIRGLRVNPDGTWKVPDELRVANYAGFQTKPKAASCGNGYLVVFEREVNNGDVWLQWLDSAGANIGNQAVVAAGTTYEGGGRVACGGAYDRYLIVWTEEYVNLTRAVWGRLAAPDGTLAPWFTIGDPVGVYDRREPAVAAGMWNTARYGFLVAWEEIDRGQGVYQDLYSRAVLTASTFLPTLPK